MIGQLLLSIVSEGLKFLNEHEARLIQEKIIALREGFRSELSKGSLRDDALLDMYTDQLRDIGELFFARIKETPPKN